MEKTCSCGAKYKLIEYHSSQRDKDSIECVFCGKELLHWDGGSFWTIEEVECPDNSNTD